jgi:3-ketosteroid 9alpha-monooxygenase subunit A
MNYRGWMFIGLSKDYAKGKVTERTLMNEKCLVFRANSGSLNVVEPYCSHFGVNMSSGHQVCAA